MTNKQAIRVAIASLQNEIHDIDEVANLHDIYNADFPSAVNASKRRATLRKAVEILLDMAEAQP